jgi:hypothetical protein
MRSDQREIGLCMIKGRRLPAVHGMTRQTIHGVLAGSVIGTPGGHIIALMTYFAVSLEPEVDVLLMAGLAVNRLMSTHEREIRF